MSSMHLHIFSANIQTKLLILPVIQIIQALRTNTIDHVAPNMKEVVHDQNQNLDHVHHCLWHQQQPNHLNGIEIILIMAINTKQAIKMDWQM